MGFYTEAAQQLITPMDVPSFFIECAQTEQQLFEGLIELDFAHVYNEAGIISLTEADEEKADDAANAATDNNTDNIWTRFIDTIKKLFNNIREAFEKLAAKTIEAAKSKILDSANVKKCKEKDVWFKDYKDACDNILQKKDIKRYIDSFGKTATNAEDEEYKLTDMMKSIDEVVADINKVPTSADEYNNKTNGKDPSMLSAGLKELGNQPMGELKECLSLKGLNQRIANCFNMLAKDDRSKFKIQKDDSDEVKKQKREGSKYVTQMRLKYFNTEIKICSTTAKIAHRNYKMIKAAVNGKTEEEGKENTKPAENAENKETETKESVILAGIASDIFCESIFEF